MDEQEVHGVITPAMSSSPVDNQFPGPPDENFVKPEAAGASDLEGLVHPGKLAIAPFAFSGPVDPVWPEIDNDHPINKLLGRLTRLIEAADGYNEVYGIRLDPAGPFLTKLILQKFLRANLNDVDKAAMQLLDILNWRRDSNPLSALNQTFPSIHYTNLGFVAEVENVPNSPNRKDIVTFSLYSPSRANQVVFGDNAMFLRWRIALMELGIQKLNLADADQPIPDYGCGPDPYQGIQVHDYQRATLLRQDPHIKAAMHGTIELMSRFYPETLSRRYFVNTPVVMGWMLRAIQAFLPPHTSRKFTVISSGRKLSAELGPGIPEKYGGRIVCLQDAGEQTKLV